MRGKVQVGDTGGDAGGITPAYAGKSKAVSGSIAAVGDHPRVCGEKVLNTFIMVCHVGSPPRMQGKGDSPPFFWTDSRITPAYAGKRDILNFTHDFTGDHPRVCGEKSLVFILWLSR